VSGRAGARDRAEASHDEGRERASEQLALDEAANRRRRGQRRHGKGRYKSTRSISGPPGLVVNRPASGQAGWGEACAGILRKGDSVRRTGHIGSDTHACVQIRGHGEPVSAHTRGQDGARFRIAGVSNSDHRLTRYAAGTFRQTTALRATGERSGTGELRAWRGRSRRYAGRSGAPAWSGRAWGWK
jgi:hypothetical protein